MNNSTGCKQFKSIGRLLVVLVALVFFGMTYLIYPATADNSSDKTSYLVSLVPPSEKAPIFNAEKVYLGITPTGWSNGDDPTIDLDPPISYQQILSEMALSGFKGSQTSGKYPTDLKTLKKELKLRNLTISEPWVGTEFTVGKKDESLKEFKKQVEFMKKIGGTSIVVAELGNAVHQKPVAPLPNRPKFTDKQWQDLTEGLNELGSIAKDEGVQISYHPHVGTGVENLADIDRLMKNTDPKNVKLLLDTGHLYYAGVDPLAVTKKYSDRIKHVHLKNIRQPVLDESIKNGLSFLDSIRAGVFTVPGDIKEGAIDFKPILKELAKAKYEGWLVVEAEQDPNKTNPLKNAIIARSYLRDVTGL